MKLRVLFMTPFVFMLFKQESTYVQVGSHVRRNIVISF